MLTPNSVGALGIAQIRPIAVKDLAQRGYTKVDGTPFIYDDCKNTAWSIDACAAYYKNAIPILERAGLSKSNPDYWGYVAMSYNSGAAGAAKSGAAHGWGSGGLSGYGLTVSAGRGSAPGGGK